MIKMTQMKGSGWGKLSLFITTAAVLAAGCHKPNVDPKDLRDFQQVNLVANKSMYNPATLVDQTLINGFGIAWSASGIAWVNSVGGHVSELYDGEGHIVRTPVNIPSPTTATGGFPCGIVTNTSKGFIVPGTNKPAAFIFNGFDGVLSAWNGSAGDNAVRIQAPNQPKQSYTGLAIGVSNGKTYIYGANFGQSKVDVWDSTFTQVNNFSFIDPTLPQGYSPYNIQAVNDYIFVVYAKLGADGHGVPGEGNGYVSVFNTNGSFVKRFASRGTLNVPWGVVAAPGSFLEDQDVNGGGEGGYKTASLNSNNKNNELKDPVVLVGNFGDGHINVYSLDGTFLGQLKSHNRVIEIQGLWALTFAPESSGISQSRLYFSAGPAGESDGIFGYLIKQ